MLRSQFTVFSDRQSPFTGNKTMQSQFTVNCLFTDHDQLKMSITNHKELKMPITCHENKYIEYSYQPNVLHWFDYDHERRRQVLDMMTYLDNSHGRGIVTWSNNYKSSICLLVFGHVMRDVLVSRMDIASLCWYIRMDGLGFICIVAYTVCHYHDAFIW